MLAGTVYFYNETMEIIKEMDLEEYEYMKEDEFYQLIQQLNAIKVTLSAFSHNHHIGKETVLYSKYKKQT